VNSKSYIVGAARLHYLEGAGGGVPSHLSSSNSSRPLLLVSSNQPPQQRARHRSPICADTVLRNWEQICLRAALYACPNALTLTMAQLASDIVVLLDHLAVREAVFVGCSIGGYVMLELWRRDPERMRGLAFICSKPQPDIEANFIKRADTIAKARVGGREELFDGMVQASIGASARARRPSIVPELRSRMVLTSEAIVAVQAGPCRASRFRSHSLHDSCPSLRNLRRRRLRCFSRGNRSISLCTGRLRASCARGRRALRGLRAARKSFSSSRRVAPSIYRLRHNATQRATKLYSSAIGSVQRLGFWKPT